MFETVFPDESVACVRPDSLSVWARSVQTQGTIRQHLQRLPGKVRDGLNLADSRATPGLSTCYFG